jgi:hypothetical protein
VYRLSVDGTKARLAETDSDQGIVDSIDLAGEEGVDYLAVVVNGPVPNFEWITKEVTAGVEKYFKVLTDS